MNVNEFQEMYPNVTFIARMVDCHLYEPLTDNGLQCTTWDPECFDWQLHHPYWTDHDATCLQVEQL